MRNVNIENTLFEYCGKKAEVNSVYHDRFLRNVAQSLKHGKIDYVFSKEQLNELMVFLKDEEKERLLVFEEDKALKLKLKKRRKL